MAIFDERQIEMSCVNFPRDGLIELRGAAQRGDALCCVDVGCQQWNAAPHLTDGCEFKNALLPHVWREGAKAQIGGGWRKLDERVSAPCQFAHLLERMPFRAARRQVVKERNLHDGV